MSALRAFISGTLLDLVEQRRAIIDVCLELGIQPLTPETLADGPAPSADVIAEPLQASDLYILVVGFRYGFVPAGGNASIVEMEYDLAKSMGKPTVVFMMSDQYPVSPRDLDIENAGRLMQFRERLRSEPMVVRFGPVAELRALAIRTLGEFVASRAETIASSPDRVSATQRSAGIATRVAFVAGPGQSSSGVIGRTRELQRLDSWCNGQPDDGPAPTMVIVGHGGMGKTALVWRFFGSASTRRFDLSGGRFWWSFYQSAQIDRFYAALFEYVAGPSSQESSRSPERLMSLLRDREMLLVLDGVERLLVGEVLPGSGPAAPIARTSDYARRIADERFRRFVLALPEFSSLRAILVSRTIPADLEAYAGTPRPGFEVMQVGGLAYDDVVDLLRRYGVTGSRDELDEMARKTAGVPLVARLLASQAIHTGKIGADPDPITTESTVHGLIGDALQRLTTLQSSILGQIARTGETVPQSQVAATAISTHVGAVELDQILTRLENLQLLEWNRAANTYNLHPLVREAVMNAELTR